MSTVTEYFNSKLVPRLIMGSPTDPGDGGTQGVDGYAYGREYSVGTDGYIIDLKQNTVYELQTRAQAIYYGVVSPADVTSKRLADMDTAEKLALLNTAGDINGHYLQANGVRNIASTRVCKLLIIKSAASTATVNLNPLSGYADDLGGR